MKPLFVNLEHSGSNVLKIIYSKSQYQPNFYKNYGIDVDGFDNVSNIKIKPLMGLTEILKNLKYIKNLKSDIIKVLQDNNITHIFFIDSFDFSKSIYKNLKKLNLEKKFKFIQIIGPSILFWRSNRAKFLNSYFDHIFFIYHNEMFFYDKHKSDFIGLPTSNLIKISSNPYNNIEIGIFLGSRVDEINNLSSTILQLITYFSDLNFSIFSTLNNFSLIKNLFGSFKNINIYLNDSNYYFKISNLKFAICCSGTVHQELTLSNIPHIVIYKTSLINYLIFQLFIKVKFVSILNIFSNKEIVREITQYNLNFLNLSKSLRYYLDKENYKEYLNLITLQKEKLLLNENNFDKIIDYLKKSFSTKAD